VKASIIVSNIEPHGVLLPSIGALCAQDFRGKFEILFPKMGPITLSQETILKHFEDQYPNFKVIDVPGNRAAMLNEAVRKAKSDLLLFEESHCIMDNNWLSRYIEVFEREKFKAAFVDTKEVPSDCWVFDAVTSQRERIIKWAKVDGSYDSFFDLHSAAITRECFEELGGFSEDVPFLTEFEFGARLHANGIRIFRAPNEAVRHFNSRTLANYGVLIKNQGFNRTKILFTRGENFFQKYFPSKSFVRLLPLLKTFRLPLMALFAGSICGRALCFKACECLRLKTAADVVFKKYAASCHRYGMLKGLKA